MTVELYTLDDLTDRDLAGQPVLVRVDFNVPFHDGVITDRTRITEALPTILELRQRGTRQILISHRGRPAGEPVPELSLAPVAEALAEELAAPVAFVADCVGAKPRQAIAELGRGGVCLLENLRFHPGEKANDAGFAEALASLATVFVCDAFGTVHRAHASTQAVPLRFERRAAGRLVEREVAQLGRLTHDPEAPFVGVLGGAKIGGKIDTLEQLIESLDVLLVGGGMANTFLAATGLDLQRSLLEPDRLEVARSILERCRERGTEVILPSDVVVTDDLQAASPAAHSVAVGELPAETMAVDIGAATVESFRAPISSAKTLFWNGPMGVFEIPPFDRGSLAVAQAVAACEGFTVLGGGETGAVVQAAGVASSLSHISTGGGASLALLAGKPLPGLEVLARRHDSN